MKRLLFSLVAFLFIICKLDALNYGILTGKTVDEQGNPLPGANIIVKGLNIGTASNTKGEFTISSMPPGKYEVMVSYIGYKTEKVEVSIKENEVKFLEIVLKVSPVRGKKVVVQAQALGQIQAINQQMSLSNIANVVSSKQIQELPEANAAEAIGRLPGVSLQRSGGEGNKLVIRGLAPKYSKIQINGITMSPTDSYDRSTDLSMISQYMLSGIELYKSLTADKEANATGGVVNFVVREAPEEPRFNVIIQGGYNDLKSYFGNYKVVVSGSRRFFNNRLGIFLQLDAERKDASSEEMGNNEYSKEREDGPVLTDVVRVRDIERRINRYNGTVVLDYKGVATKIKANTFFSIKKTTLNEHGISFNLRWRNTPISALAEKNALGVLTNSIDIEHYIGKLCINSSLGYSISKNSTPGQLYLWAVDIDNKSFPPNVNVRQNLHPYDIQNVIVLDTLSYTYEDRVEKYFGIDRKLGDLYRRSYDSDGRHLIYKIDFKYRDIVNLPSFKVDVKWGGMYKQMIRKYDQDVLYAMLSGQLNQDLINRDAYFYEFGEEDLKKGDKLSTFWCARNMSYWNLGAGSSYILAYDLYDRDRKRLYIMDDKFLIEPLLDIDLMKRLDDLLQDNPNDSIEYYENQKESVIYDYDGSETYYAGYLMFTLKWRSLTFIPGVRYEKNVTKYNGYRGDARDLTQDWLPFRKWYKTKKRRENEFYLPMIHLVWKPKKWLNIKAGYTHTLQRPNYSDIVPTVLITNPISGPIVWHNFNLEPEKARNYDLELALVSSKIGLFSISGFYKTIRDMIYYTGNWVITNEEIDFFEGLDRKTIGRTVNFAKNNEYEAIDYGVELQWMSNFWYLPGMLKGLVLNINYTRNFSETKYFRNRVIVDFDENFNLIYKNADTTYTERMVYQPDHILNLTVGYDYKGFSMRWTFRYKSNIFTNTNWYSDLRGYSTEFFRHDLSIRQKLSKYGMELYLNISNLNNEHEENVIKFEHLPIYEKYYGRVIDLGIKYEL